MADVLDEAVALLRATLLVTLLAFVSVPPESWKFTPLTEWSFRSVVPPERASVPGPLMPPVPVT